MNDDFLKPYETEEQVRERAERLRQWNERDQEADVQPSKPKTDDGDDSSDVVY